MSFKLSPENALGQTERMANVQMPIAVREGKGHNEFLLVWRSRVGLEHVVAFPCGLDFDFVGAECVA